MNEPIWQPSATSIENSNMSLFMQKVNDRFGLSLVDYEQLHRWSVENIEDFWAMIWEESKLLHSTPYKSILSRAKMWGAKWFEGSSLNFAENLLRDKSDRAALIAINESGRSQTITYSELNQKTAACASALKKLGLSKDDRVAAYMTNTPETVITMLAATSMGAVFSSCSPDFGQSGALSRFEQIKSKVLFAVDHYYYNGKRIDLNERLTALFEHLPSVERLIIVGDRKNAIEDTRCVYWEDFLASDPEPLSFAQLPFDHPVYIMYSSGTTGAPKCIVHGAGGTLLQHYKEHALHTDLTADDVMTYFTTCGWMMWNWLVGALQIGSAIVLYDGSPSHPDLSNLWRVIEKHKITVFGTSPKFLSACQKQGRTPGDEHDLTSLKTILSTGAPLSGDNFDYVYNKVKRGVQLASISGGTDIISCFMLGCPIKPVYREEIQGAGLGMKVETFNDSGQPVTNEVGELVCTAPFPSRPVYFLNDRNDEKYHKAYYDHFPGVWRHGDFIKINDHGGIIVYGRSDATLNPGGVRIGTAEIYTTVEAMEEIDDSIVIGQQFSGDTRIILFVKLSSGSELNEDLIGRIKISIRTQNSPRHVPAKIIAVNDIPHTINGKKVELAVTSVVHNRPVKNIDALANPEALDDFKNLSELNS